MNGKLRWILWVMGLFGVAFANSGAGGGGAGSGVVLDNPTKQACGSDGGIVAFTCNIMKTLLTLGPMIAVMALLVGGVIYVYASVFVTADQRGRYHSLATSLVIGALILAALAGGADFVINAGLKLLTASS